MLRRWVKLCLCAITWFSLQTLATGTCGISQSFSPSGNSLTSTDRFKLTDELNLCGWKRVVLFSTNKADSSAVDFVLQQLHVRSITVTHFQFSNTSSEVSWIKNQIWDFYHDLGMTKFILLIENAWQIISLCRDLFEKEQTSQAALMPNKMSFVMVGHSDQLPENASRSSVFDNIAMIIYQKDSRVFDSAYTLMWRENGLREWEKIASLAIGQNDGQLTSCRLFPNRENGLNGRVLTGLAKEWFPYLYKVMDTTTSNLKYTGFIIDVINALADKLNFTYKLIPEIGQDDNFTWLEFRKRIETKTVHFGASLYSVNSASYFNCSLTMPIFYSNMTGVYINRDGHKNYNMLTLFDGQIYICIFCILFSSVTYYVLVSKFVTQQRGFNYSSQNQVSTMPHSSQNQVSSMLRFDNSQLGNDRRQIVSFQSQFQVFDDLNMNTEQFDNFTPSTIMLKTSSDVQVRGVAQLCPVTRAEGNTSLSRLKGGQVSIVSTETSLGLERNFHDERIHKPHITTTTHSKSEQVTCYLLTRLSLSVVSDWYDEIIEILFGFLGSLVNQGSMPSSALISNRMLLWSWCLMILVLNATFTGNLTADMVGGNNHYPFRNFEELLTNRIYRWGVPQDTTLFTAMETAPEDSVLKKLYHAITHFAKDDPSVLGSLQTQILKVRTQPYVALIHISDVYSFRNISNLIIMQDKLLESNMGLILPQASELSDLFSQTILKMTDFGIVLAMLKKGLISIESGFRVAEDEKMTTRDLSYVLGSFYICGIVAAGAVAALIGECLLGKLALIRRYLRSRLGRI